MELQSGDVDRDVIYSTLLCSNKLFLFLFLVLFGFLISSFKYFFCVWTRAEKQIRNLLKLEGRKSRKEKNLLNTRELRERF